MRSVVTVAWVGLVGMGCRDFQEPVPFQDCQPYALVCAACSIDEDAVDDGLLDRLYRCEAEDGVVYDAVERPGIDQPTIDTHYYDPETGYRLAASRDYGEPIDVCGKERSVEWYGLILDDCVAVCELDPGLPEADPALPDCDG